MSQQLNRPASVGMHRIFASGDVASEQAVRQQGTKQTCRRSTISAITCLMHSIQPTSCNHCNYHSAPQTAQCKRFQERSKWQPPFSCCSIEQIEGSKESQKASGANVTFMNAPATSNFKIFDTSHHPLKNSRLSGLADQKKLCQAKPFQGISFLSAVSE